MWRRWRRRRLPGRIPFKFAKTTYSHSDKADSMSKRIGNSCDCREAYTPVHGRERINELRAGRQELRAGRQDLQAGRQDNRLAQPPAPARFSGSTAGFQSQESADLVVKTADGDTVRISIDALTKAQAGVYSASVGGANAGAQVFSGESSYSVKVRVKGSLDEKEAQQIGDLLEKLVLASRGAGGGAAPASTPEPAAASSFDSLSSFHYAYRAYSESTQSTLDTQAA